MRVKFVPLLAFLALFFPAVAGADTTFPPATTTFVLPITEFDPNVISLQLTVTDLPPGFTVNGVHWCFEYCYTLTVHEMAGSHPHDWLSSISIPQCGNPFLALPPTGGPGAAFWFFNSTGDPLLFEVGDPVTNGIADGAVFTFCFFSNNSPVPGTITVGGKDKFCRSCLCSVIARIPYWIPCGPPCTPPGSPCVLRCPAPLVPNADCSACVCPLQCPPGTTPSPDCRTCLPPPPGQGNCSHSFKVAQVYPAVPGVQPAAFPYGCWKGGTTPQLFTNAVVPGVLCLDSDPTTHLLNLSSFLDPACCSSPTVQFVTLTKEIPGSQKCPDTYQHTIYTQTGDPQHLSAIRTWWPLMYSQPGTTISLTVRGVCHSTPQQTFTDTWSWTIVANPQSFRLLIDWLHTSEIDMLETPCIVGEDTYQALVACADLIASTIAAFKAAPSPATRTAAQDAIFNCESLVLGASFAADVVDTTFPRVYSAKGPPPNPAQPAPAGFGGIIGIFDTEENPCGCKLIVDLESIFTSSGLG